MDIKLMMMKNNNNNKLPVKSTGELSNIRFDLKTVDYVLGIKYFILYCTVIIKNQ